MKNTIIFRINVNEEESYGALASFIYKRESHLELTDKEVERVRYKFYLRNAYETARDWAGVVSADSTEFTLVNEPEKIKNTTEKYEVIYCLCVDRNADIVDLHNLFLIMHYYKKLNIIALYEEFEDDLYYKISQFSYLINTRDSKFYNSCFFVNGGKIKRAQLNRVEFSRKFIPMQIVDEEHYRRLFQNIRELLNEEDLHKIFLKSKLESAGEARDLLEGTVKLLRSSRKIFSRLDEKSVIKIFLRLDVFSFILLCYVVCSTEREWSILELEECAYVMRQYSSAVRQLAENIVFHSKTGFGAIVFRVHEKNAPRIEMQYGIKKDTRASDFLEILVSDFCGGEPSENIADHFVANLEEGDIKEKFRKLRPEAFFSHAAGNEMEAVWKEFYQDPDHIGKHFGLRIFQSIVSSFDGLFGAESHKGYSNQPGDSFLSYAAKNDRACMPGTRYHIVLSVRPLQEAVKKQDFSLDGGISISGNIRQLLDYRTDDIYFQCGNRAWQSQEEKNKRIKAISERLQESLCGKDCDIIYMSADDIEENMGELFTKALVIALYHTKKDMIFVCYQCTDHLKETIFDTLRIFLRHMGMEGMFFGRRSQIVLYTKEFEERVIDLSSADCTDSINAYISHMKCISAAEKMGLNTDGADINRGAERYIPCDSLHEVEISGKSQTLFEHYTELVLNRNIQQSDFGCKLEHTHMRLGSTIHIDSFYEAEILFGNKLFVSRFALLLVKDMIEDIRDIEKLTLYGYGTYSETVLVQMVEMIHNYYPQKKDIDYIILEREEERRGFLHTDRIRYNRLFHSKEDRVEYFRERKVAVIVLINSTLKTHARLINLFKDETGKNMQTGDWLIQNYAVLLVGSDEKNSYWKLCDGKKVELKKEKISPNPRYFIQLDVDYKEPLSCDDCFPENPMAETPLIEVNAASTIPNQAFGIIEASAKNSLKIDYPWIQREEEQMECLKGEFLYGHVQRNENHFLYYFKTENIWMQEQENIRKSLSDWKNACSRINGLQYHIIVAPMHFSNAGFVEMVNHVVFGGNAILLRIDFDKEYRSNAYAKYSYLRNYIKQMRALSEEGVVCVHYVDDAIISGRTFHRAKSLIESILEINYAQEDHVEIRIFDKVFVLIDRNSMASRMQYVKAREDFYSFIHVNISSLRNYGDSCVCCNLKKEADILWDTASTSAIAEYWERSAGNFELCALDGYDKRQKELEAGRSGKGEKKQDPDRAFRRLFCTHMAQCVLEEKYHGNDKVETMYLILELLNTDYVGRKKDRYEYFLSYLKCISRPFLVFRKCVREAIFDILLLLIDTVVRNESLTEIVREAKAEKSYLDDRRLKRKFAELDQNVLRDPALTKDNWWDLVRILMKQLTELKSNYIIRPEKMDAIFAFMNGTEQRRFEVYYMSLIGRLVGAKSDTNKSIWLDEQIERAALKHVSLEYKTWILLENTRAFRDGIEKFFHKRSMSEEFCRLSDQRIAYLKKYYDYVRAQMMFKDFMEKNRKDLEANTQNTMVSDEAACRLEERIQQFIKSLPELESINARNQIKKMREGQEVSWSKILNKVNNRLQRNLNGLESTETRKEEEDKLWRFINEESDIYQYGNFYRVLEKDGYMNGAEVTVDGIDMIICCTKILCLCKNKELGILDKVGELALLFRVILRAQKIQFIVENKEDNYLSEWKQDIEERYNRLVAFWNEGAKERLPEIRIRKQGQYAVIVEKSNIEGYNVEVSESTERLIEDLRTGTDCLHDYILNREAGLVVWKLENKQRSIWISIENSKWIVKETGQELKVARDMRRLMAFYQELKREIFNPENDDFMNEISHITKELSIYSSNKVYTHTKEYSQRIQYEQVLSHLKEGDEAYKSFYPYYVLNLLADINVSKYYRNGLGKRLYADEMKFGEPAMWKDFSEVFQNNREFIYRAGEAGEVSVKLAVGNMKEGEEVLCRKNADSIREVLLLIYALILNAAEQGRGKRQKAENGMQRVTVKLYSEDGFLIIENECEKPVDIESVRRRLEHVPESEEDGISLWSFNCYIKRCINSLIMEKIKKAEYDLEEGQLKKEYLFYLGKWIQKLTGETCEIQPEEPVRNGRRYFRLKLPIFMKKYDWEWN